MKGIRNLMGFLVAILMVTSGCATISGGTRQTIEVQSTPSHAKVTIGAREYVTPTSIKLARSRDHMLVVRKTGYKGTTVHLGRNFRGLATIGGNLFWLLPGLLVDGLTGAWYEFDENSLHVVLEPKDSASKEAKDNYKKALSERKKKKTQSE